MSSAATRPESRRARRTQAERSEETRSRILDAALLCVAEEGFQRTNLARIAERAGVSLGAIQHQFGDRARVMGAAVQRSFDALLAAVPDLPAESGSLDERVGRLVGAIWDRYAMPESRAALEIVLQMRAEPDFVATALPYLARIRGAIDGMWMGIFAEAGASRERHIRAQRLLFTSLNGLAVEATLMPAGVRAAADLETLREGILRALTPEA